MKLFEQQDDKGKKKSKTNKLLRQKKHRIERRRAKLNPEVAPQYNKYKGYQL